MAAPTSYQTCTDAQYENLLAGIPGFDIKAKAKYTVKSLDNATQQKVAKAVSRLLPQRGTTLKTIS